MSYPFVRSPNYTSGRPYGVRFVVIHDMEVAETSTSAENVANYFASTAAGVSAHFCVDENSIIRCVYDEDRAWHCMTTGNQYGVGIEIAGYASQTTSQWEDEYSKAALDNAAEVAAVTCKKWGIPVKHLSVDELRNGEHGIVTHADVTNAWHETTHTDPGPNFPMSYFIGRVNAKLNPTPNKPTPAKPTPKPVVKTYGVPGVSETFRGKDVRSVTAVDIDNGLLTICSTGKGIWIRRYQNNKWLDAVWRKVSSEVPAGAMDAARRSGTDVVDLVFPGKNGDVRHMISNDNGYNWRLHN